jgi:hypothetical protein
MSKPASKPGTGMAWFRFYHEWASDPKVQIMAEAMQRRLVMLFCIQASTGIDELPPSERDEHLALSMRISLDEVATTRVEFVKRGFIDTDWTLRNWDARQFVSDSSAERMRRHRASKRSAVENVTSDGAVTSQPDDVTSHSGKVTAHVRHSDALDTEKETDTETETETEEEKSGATAADVAVPAPSPSPVVDSTSTKPTRPKRATRTKRDELTLSEWLASLPEGEDAIPGSDPVNAYAASVGLPDEFVTLEWHWLKCQYGEGGTGSAKRYTDWRAVFRNAVRKGWGDLWAFGRDGSPYLKTAGQQLQREMQAAGGTTTTASPARTSSVNLADKSRQESEAKEAVDSLVYPLAVHFVRTGEKPSEDVRHQVEAMAGGMDAWRYWALTRPEHMLDMAKHVLKRGPLSERLRNHPHIVDAIASGALTLPL